MPDAPTLAAAFAECERQARTRKGRAMPPAMVCMEETRRCVEEVAAAHGLSFDKARDMIFAERVKDV